MRTLCHPLHSGSLFPLFQLPLPPCCAPPPCLLCSPLSLLVWLPRSVCLCCSSPCLVALLGAHVAHPLLSHPPAPPYEDFTSPHNVDCPVPDPTRPPPPLIILWGAFFVNQIEAKALSRFRHPQRSHTKNFTTPGFEPGIFGIAVKFLDNLPTSSDSVVQQRVHRFNMLSQKSPPCEKLPPAHLPPAQRHNRKGHQQTARQGSCDQRKKVWQEPNPGNPQNYKRGGGSRALDPPTRLKTHPPRTPPPLQLNSYKRSLTLAYLFNSTLQKAITSLHLTRGSLPHSTDFHFNVAKSERRARCDWARFTNCGSLKGGLPFRMPPCGFVTIDHVTALRFNLLYPQCGPLAWDAVTTVFGLAHKS